MPVESHDLMENGLVQSRLRETVKMSTYLVAFVVCDFKHSERITKTGKLVGNDASLLTSLENLRATSHGGEGVGGGG